MLSLANSDAERTQVQQLFTEVFGDEIDPNAVPMTHVDHLYVPLIVQAHSDDGDLIGAALTCAPQKAAGLAMLPPHLQPPGLLKAAKSVRELDLMAVVPQRRGEGIGAAMVNFMEPVLAAAGVKAWFGNVTSPEDADFLRTFYTDLGFKVLVKGQPLPPFRGQEWSVPVQHPPVFNFWKKPVSPEGACH